MPFGWRISDKMRSFVVLNYTALNLPIFCLVRRAVAAEQSSTFRNGQGVLHIAEYCCDKKISYPYWSETLSKYLCQSWKEITRKLHNNLHDQCKNVYSLDIDQSGPYFQHTSFQPISRRLIQLSRRDDGSNFNHFYRIIFMSF